MKKTMAVITLSFLAFACSDETQVIKQSINNIKDEMVSMQSEMAEMKISIEDVDRKTEANKESINANAGALAEIRSELSFIGNEVTVLKEGQKAPAPGASAVLEPAQTADGENLIIIEDAFTDKSSLYSYAYELYRNGKYAESEAKFNEFLAKYPSDELSDNAVYWLGEIQYSQKNYEGAITLFNKLVSDYPDGNKVPDGLLKMAYSYGNIGKKAESVVTLKKIVNEYPGTRAFNLAKKKLASMGE
jgi:tol-pal system protein YbgF